MTTCNAAPAPGISHPKTTIEDETALDQEQHSAYRRLVGKIQWLAHPRPDISYGAKELARSLQAPTQMDNKKLKHMIRYLKGTRYWKHALRPTVQMQDRRIPIKIDIYTDAGWASCETTRKSTTGFAIHFLGATILWKQNTGNNSSVISRVRAIHNWYSCTRKHLHQQLRQGSFGHKDQHQNTHRQQLG